MHKVPTTLLHSLEGMSGLDWKQLLKLQSQDGSFLFSPSSTAFALMQTKDQNSLNYLNKAVNKFNGGGKTQKVLFNLPCLTLPFKFSPFNLHYSLVSIYNNILSFLIWFIILYSIYISSNSISISLFFYIVHAIPIYHIISLLIMVDVYVIYISSKRVSSGFV